MLHLLSTYNTCTKYCSPNLLIPDFCVIDPVVTTTTTNYAWNMFPEIDGIPQYCTNIKLRASSTFVQNLPLLIDCSQGKTTNAIIDYVTATGKTAKPVVNAGY